MNSNILKQKRYEAVIWICGILRLNISTISYQDFWSKMFGYRYFISTHTTIIIKTVGKAATFNLFFRFPRPWPHVKQKLSVCVGEFCYIPTLSRGNRGNFAQEKTIIKMNY